MGNRRNHEDTKDTKDTKREEEPSFFVLFVSSWFSLFSPIQANEIRPRMGVAAKSTRKKRFAGRLFGFHSSTGP
jgi:hypothetical protein